MHVKYAYRKICEWNFVVEVSIKPRVREKANLILIPLINEVLSFPPPPILNGTFKSHRRIRGLSVRFRSSWRPHYCPLVPSSSFAAVPRRQQLTVCFRHAHALPEADRCWCRHRFRPRPLRRLAARKRALLQQRWRGVRWHRCHWSANR